MTPFVRQSRFPSVLSFMKIHNICIQLLSLVAAVAPVCAAEVQYHLIKEIPIGGEGTWDRMTLDEKGRRLYITHENKIEVLDIDKEQLAGQITGTPGVHDFALAPRFNR